MPVGTMPDPSSPQFMPWLKMQDAQTQQTVVRALGQMQASGNPMSIQGGYAPELEGFAYDAPSMLGGIPLSTNSKGEPNPYNVETQAKRLNYAQDTIGSGGLGSDMLSMITGGQATDPSAWKPTRKGTGSPLTFEGQTYVDSYANSGAQDWQTYVAQRIAAGDNPATAVRRLKQLVQGSDGVSVASPELVASLDSNPDWSPALEGEKTPDVKTDQGFATLYDAKGMNAFAQDLFKGVVKDKALQSSGYQDPKTGQYFSGYVDEDTPQMKAAKELGLAFPTQSYADDDYIKGYQQQALGSDDTYDEANRQGRVAEIGQARDALTAKAGDAQDYMTAVMRAYQASQPKPPYEPPTQAEGRPLSSTPFGASADALDPAVLASFIGTPAAAPAEPFSASGTVHWTRPEMSPERERELRTGQKSTMVPQKKASKGAVKSAQDLGAAYAMGSTRAPGRAELDAAIASKTKANQNASDARQAYYRSQFMNDDEMERAKLAASMRYLAHQGRSPLQDQLSARSQTLRNLIGY